MGFPVGSIVWALEARIGVAMAHSSWVQAGQMVKGLSHLFKYNRAWRLGSGYLKDGDGDGNSQPHKGVQASASSDVMYSFTSAQDGDPLQDDVRLCLGDDLKKAQDHKEAGDFGVGVVCLQTCLTEILGFLEKFEGGFEQDIDNEGEKDREDEDGDGGVS
ncbi:hypothetical protein Tco_1203161 [Tanacetum coccineum]